MARGAGIFDGAGGGIFTSGRRLRREAAAREQARQETVAGIDVGVDELIANTADPGEAAAWRDQFESYRELALSQDELLQREGLNGLANMATAVRGAVDRKRAAQETFITEQARELRTRHEKATVPMRELQANMGALNALLQDPEFDQNLALNRGTLIGLLESSTRQMLSDPEDMADALIGAGGSGLIGALTNLAGGYLAAEDFDFRKEDYARIARAMYTFNEKRYRETVTPIELEAAALDQAAAGLDFLPAGYTLTRYVTGGDESFENPLRDSYTDAPSSAAALTSSGPLQNLIDRAPEGSPIGDGVAWMREHGFMADPTDAAADRATGPEGVQFGGVRDSQIGPMDKLLGYDDIMRGLNGRLEKLVGDGATIRADPKNGNLFAIYEDGRREPVATSQLQRRYVLEGLKSGQQSVSGRIRR